MSEDWKDREIARHWSTTAFEGNPTRPEQLNVMLAVLETEYKPGTAILDLGFGSGLVESLIFQRIPGAFVTGVESSPAMLELAAENLAPFVQQYEVIEHDLAEIDTLKLPDRTYSAVISVQTLHHLSSENKLKIFRFVHDLLPRDGVFVLIDRVAIPGGEMYPLYKALWRRLFRIHGSPMPAPETYEEFRKEQKEKADYPATLEEHLLLLKQAGFGATPLYVHANRVVIGAVKKETGN